MTHAATPQEEDRTAVDGLLGFDVWSGSLERLVQSVVVAARRPGRPAGWWLACLNPHSYMQTRHDQKFEHALRQASWLLPDGVGVVIASRILNKRIAGRISGPDAFLAISSALNQSGPFTVLFMGSAPATLDKVAKRYRHDFPNATGIETFSPPFKPAFDAADLDAMRAAIGTARPDVLWVGLTAPKQETLLAEFSLLPDFRFGAAIGAAFDFYAGNVKRSHPVFRRMGLEWLPRLIQEPRRLWRRTFVSAPRFLWHVGLAALSSRRIRSTSGSKQEP